MGIFNDFFDAINELGDYFEAKDKFDNMESEEVMNWFSQKIIDYGSDFSDFVEGEGINKVSCMINRLKSISEDYTECDFIRLAAKLQYATCLLDGVPHVLDSNPTKSVMLLKIIIQETQLLKGDFVEDIVIKDTYARACMLLGLCYAYGSGCLESPSNAEKYIRKAAEAGLSEAEDILDMMNDI